jgi:hypothetical protein
VKILIPFLAFFISGCAQSYFSFITPEFRPYSNEFISRSKTHVPPLVIKFGNTDKDQAAVCVRNLSRQTIVQALVVVNKSEWANLCESQKRFVIFHELGHCIKNREHSDSTYSYMYQEVLGCAFLNEFKDTLDNEMFL